LVKKEPEQPQRYPTKVALKDEGEDDNGTVIGPLYVELDDDAFLPYDEYMGFDRGGAWYTEDSARDIANHFNVNLDIV
jgi:hypothetical protein